MKLKKGMVSKDIFLELCRIAGNDESKAENIRSYLLALCLSVETTEGQLFIPSLVSDENNVKEVSFVRFLTCCIRYLVRKSLILNC